MDWVADEPPEGNAPGFDPQTGTQPFAVQVSPVYKALPALISCRLGTRRSLGGCGSEEEPPPTTANTFMSSSYTTITGTDTANTLIVDTSGDDSVKALGGNDTVTGSGGNDIVDLAGGNDLVKAGDYSGGTIYGGAGNDTIYSANTFSASAVYRC